MDKIQNEVEPELRQPPNIIQTHFASGWGVVTPAVYRYEDECWIDEFFESGKLRLSTFAKFATYEDEVRGDPGEGFGLSEGKSAQGQTYFIVHGQGTSAYVFCTSHKLERALCSSFKRDSAFQITNTMGFAFEIKRQLQGFIQGLEGNCIYRHDGIIRRAIDLNITDYEMEDGNIDMQMTRDLSTSLGGPELLLKKAMKYSNQAEYRFLWEVDSIASDHIDLIVPGARKHCRKVTDAEWW